MKIFIQRDGGQLPNYAPKGTVDTDDLPLEEAEVVINALKPEHLTSRGVRSAGTHSAIPDGYRYHIRIQQESTSQEFDVSENTLPADVQEALQLLVRRVSRA